MTIRHRIGIALVGLVLLAAVQPEAARAAGKPSATKLIRALSAKAFKVRLQAAIQIGKQRVQPALAALRKAADGAGEHPAVRAAALVSLAQLADQESRQRCAYLVAHDNPLIAKAADKALRLLDQSLPQKPYYLVSIAQPRLPKDVPADRAKLVFDTLSRRVTHTGGLVLGAGEERFLHDDQLGAHLKGRDLTGLLIEPELLALRADVADGRTTLVAQLRLVQYSLPGKRREFAGEGGADAWIETTRISASERRELETEVLEGAANAALNQLLQDLRSRAE